MNLSNVKKIYFIGIEGAGTSALAVMFKKAGYEVSGSDEGDHFYFEILKDSGIKVFHKFAAENIPRDADLVVYSLAFKNDTNPETAAAKKMGKKLLSYGEALALLFNQNYGISVCGCHGKSTTSAWLAFVLEKARRSPKLIVGAKVPQFGANYLSGFSEYFVLESDEYGNKLEFLNPKAVLLNNIEYDHPDFFPSFDDYLKVFVKFIERIPKKGFLVANFDDQAVRRIAPVNTRAKVISYAIDEPADYVAYDIRQAGERQFFKVKIGVSDFENEDDDAIANSELGDFAIRLSGKHNVYNALAVIASAIELGVDLVDVRTHLEDFAGISRRMEKMGEFRGALIYDDYAHHPTEIRATLAGARGKFGNKKIRVVFHPHTFTRTKALLDDFAMSFDDADEVIVLDIYGSARETQGGVHSRDLVQKIKSEIRNQKSEIKYIATLDECEKYLRETIERDEVIILMGAGDVFRIGERLVKYAGM